MKTLNKYISLFLIALCYVLTIGFELMVAVISYIPSRLTFSHETGMLAIFIWVTVIPFFWWVTKWNRGRENDLRSIHKAYRELMAK